MALTAKLKILFFVVSFMPLASQLMPIGSLDPRAWDNRGKIAC
jgi:hypothetical protein